ncbi:MAG: dTDP-glucose 4,6-dehydratase [Oscillospiraceae bacterium]|jgi:dTDP-glucose 4,6-dehydratase|nr:dTDP-glucose 4,6-dehydratase [Oscillospiraceae bacterium]
MKKILVTGGAGFIGSNFIQYILDHQKDLVLLVNLDALTYAGNLENLKAAEQDARYRFVKGDVRDKELVEQLFQKYDFDTVVHFAAESHVDRSITDPEVFLTTNILGTHTLLEAAKSAWKCEPDNKHSKDYREGVRYLQVSTDEVYGALGKTGMFTEATPLAPNSPYSASKASADMLVRAYYQTFGLPVNITRCSNNYGPYQFPEKLIPLMIHNAQHDKPLPVYGDGMQIRDWLHVKDHCAAIAAVLEAGRPGEIYNIGGNNEKANLEIVRLILKELDKSEELIQYVQDRPGHDRRYAIDNTKITAELGWRPAYTFEQGIHETIQWYLQNTGWVERAASVGTEKIVE